MALRKSALAVQQRHLTLHDCYNHLLVAASTPITVSDLAQATGWQISLVAHMLHSAPWWTQELAAASRAEAYRRYQARLISEGQSGIEKARAARSPNVRRVLTRKDVAAIRARLDTGETMAHLAKAFGVSTDTILNIKHRHTWNDEAPEPPTYEVEMQIQPGVQSTTCLGLDQGLWERLGKPERVQMSRQRGYSLVLEAAAAGLPVQVLGASALWTVVLGQDLQRDLHLPAQDFICLASLTQNNRLYLSDFPKGEREDMLTVAEAARLLQVSRQAVENAIETRRLQPFFDGGRSRQVLSTSEVRSSASQSDSTRTRDHRTGRFNRRF
jgi:hypothetical protein